MNLSNIDINKQSSVAAPIIGWVTVLLANMVILFSLSVLFGWYAHISELIRYEPGTIAMVFNTALCFIMFAVAIQFSYFKVPYIPYVLCSLILLICGMVAIEQIYDVQLGIDQLFFSHYDSLGNNYPGRMAPNTAFCFVHSTLTLWLINSKYNTKICLIAGGTLSALLFTLAIVFISGYLSDIQDAYQWGVMTPMATTTAFGFLLLSITLLSFTLNRSIIEEISIFRYLPSMFSICLVIATFILSIKIVQYEIANNNYTSSLSTITFLSGVFLAFMVGSLAYLVQVAMSSANTTRRALTVLQATLESTADGILVISTQGKIVAYNHKFLNIMDIPEEIITYYTQSNLIEYELTKVFNQEEFIAKNKYIDEYPDREMTDEINLKNGTIIERYVKPQISQGILIGRVYSYRDVTLRKRLENELARQSTYDSLTDLPNRALLLDIIRRSIDAAKSNYTLVGLFLIDIDKFSHINDLFGRSKGDILLTKIAAIIKNNLPENCILGRIGGDEFLVVNYDLKRTEVSYVVINTLLKIFSEHSLDLFDHEMKVTACIGASIYPKDGKDVDSLLANADIAMLRAKKEGRNSFRFYTEDMNIYTLKSMQLETKLHRAIDEEQFVVYYQPLVDLKSKKTIGVEALLRWINDEGDLISPLDFIPLAEDMGLISDIGNIVLRDVCKQSVIWEAQGLTDLKIAVNVSGKQFKYGKLVETVKKYLRDSGMKPKNLELELTESILLSNSDYVSTSLNELDEFGITISIDDFGTGYSSFSYVKKFPISKIKIDRSFIIDSVNNPQDHAIVTAMAVMAHTLNYKILAEGIENKEQLDFLTSVGCDQGQGYYFSRPMTAENCTKFLKDNK